MMAEEAGKPNEDREEGRNSNKRITAEDMLAMSRKAQELKAQGDEQMLSKLEEKLFAYGQVETQDVMDGLRSVLEDDEDEDSD